MTSKQEQNKKPWLSADTVKRLLACLVGVCFSAVLWIIPFTGPILQKQLRLIDDYFVRKDYGLEPRKDIVFLGIDADSMQLDSISEETIQGQPALNKMSAAWPWDRSVHAAMIDRLAGAGAKLIVIDLVFAQPSSAEGDKALADAIARHRDKVVLASAFIPGEDGGQMRVVEPLDDFLGPLDDETASGYVNFWPHGEDGVVRHAHFTMTLGEANHVDLVHPDEPVFQSLAAASARKLGVVPPGKAQRFRMARIKEKNANHVYKAQSYYTIFVPEIWQSRYKNGAFFKDKIVFIGPASPLFQDSHQTPSGQVLGAQLHMHVLTAILEDAWYKDYDPTAQYILIFVLIGLILSCAFCSKWSKTWILGAVFVVGAVLWFCLEKFFVSHDQRLIGSLASVSTFGLGLLGAIIWQAMSERAQRQQLHRHLRRSMSPDVADAIVRAPEGYYKAASGNRREVTVLFTDIRGFTRRSEEQDAGELVSQLNTYFERMVDVIFSHGGTVDKFIGDAIMATWGALGDSDSANQVNQAAAASRKMLEVLAELNKKWITQGLQPFHIGIGIHHGEAIVGEVGSDQRTDFTVIGDAVNLASRIEGLTKTFGVDLFVSGSVSKMLDQSDDWMEIARVRVKGRDGGVALSMLAAEEASENEQMQLLAENYAAGEWQSARELAHQLFKGGHFAGVAQFYLNLLGGDEAPASDWDGLITMQTK